MARKTREQLIEYHKEQIKKLKTAESRAKRNARTKRLCASAGQIESIAGVELDPYLSTVLGEKLKELIRTDQYVMEHMASRKGKEATADAREDDLR